MKNQYTFLNDYLATYTAGASLGHATAATKQFLKGQIIGAADNGNGGVTTTESGTAPSGFGQAYIQIPMSNLTIFSNVGIPAIVPPATTPSIITANLFTGTNILIAAALIAILYFTFKSKK